MIINRGNMLFCCTAVLAVIAFFGWLMTGAGIGAASPSYRPTTELVQEAYTFQVSLTNSTEAVMLKPNPFTVTIHNADQRPASGAAVDITIYMPDMFCGTSTVKAKEIQPGVYQGDGIPLMAGKSAAEVKVQLDGRTFTVEHPFLTVRR
ncbi:FixH family protein [Paenibacillus radicis (ex Xue et al. 2023)]|uniref:FixH family protein n=1 Tax=Paenibacillus radicis (ex Xue et al. 2023) TaxID=2972489 RepID=A0ABT1Y9D4_9BACL|nr:FixH family protein [Paenibacillus radicis (ex Xue et al. 2023)]MCR8629791.1 FixH family protein [Paenibacillus radicis (ex Xue et al. 2023)]